MDRLSQWQQDWQRLYPLPLATTPEQLDHWSAILQAAGRSEPQLTAWAHRCAFLWVRTHRAELLAHGLAHAGADAQPRAPALASHAVLALGALFLAHERPEELLLSLTMEDVLSLARDLE